ncbi:MAG: T9SS type A sorting domain-containing protein [Bacteroidetes bacterium]|nr:T9SS type A sorting domain-containing protein [Bacteroidota bacterium]
MKRKIITVLLLYVFCTNLCAQNISVSWQQNYGGTDYESPSKILITADGGFIFASSTSSNDGDISLNNGFFDYWIVKTDQSGEIEWESSFGEYEGDICHDMIPGINGGWLAVGFTTVHDPDTNTNTNVWVVKIDGNGEMEWQESYGGSESENAFAVIATSDSNYMLAGMTNSSDGDVSFNNGDGDIWLIKIDTDGQLLWEKTYGGSLGDLALYLIELPDSGILITGYSYSSDGDIEFNYGYHDAVVIRTDNVGNMLWQKTYGGSGQDKLESVVLCDDNGFLIAGRTNSDDHDVTGHIGEDDIWILKLDSGGNLEWQKTFGGSDNEYLGQIIKSEDNKYIVIATSYSDDYDLSSNAGEGDIWIFEIDTSGNKGWSFSAGGSGFDYALKGCPLYEGKLIIIARSNSIDGDFTLNYGFDDIWLLILEMTNSDRSIESHQKSCIYPNPTGGEFTVFIENSDNQMKLLALYDALGGLIWKKISDDSEVKQNISKLPEGIYYLNIIGTGYSLSKKIIKH